MRGHYEHHLAGDWDEHQYDEIGNHEQAVRLFPHSVLVPWALTIDERAI
jgi:hypothetical protein